jgi:hypothetical protein
MNFARCKCDERATQWLMHNVAFALHVGNESCCAVFAPSPLDVAFASAHRSLRADMGAVIATGLHYIGIGAAEAASRMGQVQSIARIALSNVTATSVECCSVISFVQICYSLIKK